jgi:hypothetical protein
MSICTIIEQELVITSAAIEVERAWERITGRRYITGLWKGSRPGPRIAAVSFYRNSRTPRSN